MSAAFTEGGPQEGATNQQDEIEDWCSVWHGGVHNGRQKRFCGLAWRNPGGAWDRHVFAEEETMIWVNCGF